MKLTVITIIGILLTLSNAQTPGNDDCTGAEDLGLLATGVTRSTSGSTIDATDDGLNCLSYLFSPGIWYKVQVVGPSDLTVSTCDGATNYDTAISVFKGVDCNNLTCVAGNDDVCSQQSSVTVPVCNTTEYFILVHGYRDSVGDFNLTVTSVAKNNDTDGDGVLDVCDNCPFVATTNRTDSDGDGVGDICDNCPDTPNSDQTDVDGDGIGDACDKILVRSQITPLFNVQYCIMYINTDKCILANGKPMNRTLICQGSSTPVALTSLFP